MNFLDRLEALMAQKGVSKAQLATQAGISKTTVYAWWVSGWEGITLPRLRALCDYFGCSLDYLVNGDGEEPTQPKLESSVQMVPGEQELLRIYRSLNSTGKELLMANAKAYDGNPELKQDRSCEKAI